MQVADSLQRFLNSSTDPAELSQFQAACYQNDPNNFLATAQQIMTADGAALPPPAPHHEIADVTDALVSSILQRKQATCKWFHASQAQIAARDQSMPSSESTSRGLFPPL